MSGLQVALAGSIMQAPTLIAGLLATHSRLLTPPGVGPGEWDDGISWYRPVPPRRAERFQRYKSGPSGSSALISERWGFVDGFVRRQNEQTAGRFLSQMGADATHAADSAQRDLLLASRGSRGLINKGTQASLQVKRNYQYNDRWVWAPPPFGCLCIHQ